MVTTIVLDSSIAISFKEFKDENSRVVAVVPVALAAWIQSDLTFLMQGLAAAIPSTTLNYKAATQLQRKMRQGQPITADDFDSDPQNLWIYAKRKFFHRSVIWMETCRLASSIGGNFVPSLTAVDTIVSLGGGPGNDLFGYLLWHKFFASGRLSTSVDSGDIRVPKLYVMDFAMGWKPIVDTVSELSGHGIQFAECNLLLPLSCNEALMQQLDEARMSCTHRKTHLFLVSFVLNELMTTTDANTESMVPLLLQDLFASYKRSMFLFREPNSWALQRVIQAFPEWVEFQDYWWLRSDMQCSEIEGEPTYGLFVSFS